METRHKAAINCDSSKSIAIFYLVDSIPQGLKAYLNTD